MKKLWKMAAIGAALVLSLGLVAGCGSDQSAEKSDAPKVAVLDKSKLPSDVQAIVDRGTLRIGVKNVTKGFGYQDPTTNEYSGLEVDLAKNMAAQLGVKLELTPVTAATRTALLDSGDIDAVLATFTITDARKKSWDFTEPYYTDHVGVLVENASNIKSLADLKGKTVGVSSGSTSAKALVEAMIKAGVIDGTGYDSKTFDPATWTNGVKFKQYDDYPAISTALSAKEVDAFCVDKSILNIYKTDGRSYIKEEFAPQDYGIATKKGSGLSKVAEEMVQRWKKDGTLQKLIDANGLAK